MVKEIATLADFDKLLDSNPNKLIVVDFTATWCGPCQRIAPIIKTMSDEMPNIEFVKVDVDANAETSEKCSISAMPTFHFYKNKVLLHQFSGASEDKLREAVVKFQ